MVVFYVKSKDGSVWCANDGYPNIGWSSAFDENGSTPTFLYTFFVKNNVAYINRLCSEPVPQRDQLLLDMLNAMKVDPILRIANPILPAGKYATPL